MEEISYSGSSPRGQRKLPKRLIVFGGLFLVVLILLGSAIYFITREKSPEESIEDNVTNSIDLPQEEEIKETPAPTEETSPTPEEATPTKSPSKAPTSSAAKNDVKIAVQNGSGETGAAASAADVLKNAGFTIASTGNADNSDYTDVTIQIKNSKKASLSGIEDALSSDYTVGDTSTDLPESTSYDVLVIIGK